VRGVRLTQLNAEASPDFRSEFAAVLRAIWLPKPTRKGLRAPPRKSVRFTGQSSTCIFLLYLSGVEPAVPCGLGSDTIQSLLKNIATRKGLRAPPRKRFSRAGYL